MVRITRVQHPVGHGGFHTGDAITATGKRFTWVFDCGSQSETRIKEVVRDWCAANGGPIDWLFVSHFDTDHANGIDTLMERVTVKNVMVPYVGIEDLIVTLLHEVDSDRHERWLFELAADPVEFFQARGARHVVILGAQGPEPEDIATYIQPDDPAGGWATKLTYGPVHEKQVFARNAGSSPQPKVLQIPHVGCDIYATQGVETVDLLLKPYCTRVDSTTLPNMLKELMRASGHRLSTWSKTFPSMGLGDLARRIAELARDNDGRKELRRIYRAYAGSPNRSSLSLLSIPLTNRPLAMRTVPRDLDLDNFPWPPWGKPTGWLNTGDAELLKPADLGRWSRNYAQHLGEVAMLALPHHGSNHNSDAELQERCPHALLTAQVRSGASKHPGNNVATAAGNRLWKVTEKPESAVTVRLSFPKTR